LLHEYLVWGVPHYAVDNVDHVAHAIHYLVALGIA